MPPSILRRSVYTILMVALTLTAAVSLAIPSRAAPAVAMTFAAIGVFVGIGAWASIYWRRNAGLLRHVIVTLAALACAAICVKAMMIIG